MPKSRVWVGVAHYAISFLGIFRKRIAGTNSEGGRTWTGGEDGGVGVYNFDDEHYVVVTNPKEHNPKCLATLTYPEAIAPQVKTAILEGRKRFKKEIDGA